FGLVGTVQLPAKPRAEVKVALKGAGLVPLDKWVKRGEVFVVSRIPEGDGPGRQMPWSLLQVVKAPGEAGQEGICQLYNPGAGPLPPAPFVAGYRCLKIATGKFPLRVQLMQVQPDGQPPVPFEQPTQVKVRYHGFQGEEKTLLLATARDGLLDTAR